MSCLWVTLTLLLWQIQPPSPCPAVTPMFPPILSCDPVWTLTHLLPFNMQTSHFHSPDSLLCLLCTLMSYPSDPSPFLWPSAFWILILSLTHLDNFASFCIHTSSKLQLPFLLQYLSSNCASGSSSVLTEPLHVALGASEPVSVAVWSGLIKAGSASGSVTVSRGSGPGDSTESYSSRVSFPSRSLRF